MEAIDLINWSSLSRYLSGEEGIIRKGRYSDRKYGLRVRLLIYFIDKWMGMCDEFDGYEKSASGRCVKK